MGLVLGEAVVGVVVGVVVGEAVVMVVGGGVETHVSET